MLSIFLSLLGRFWWAIPLAGAAAFGALEHHEVTERGTRIVQLKQQASRDQASIAQLRAGISEQNAGVERILQQGVANVAAAKALASARDAAANRVRVVYQTTVEQIEAAQVPQECGQAASWAAGQAGQLVKGWQQ